MGRLGVGLVAGLGSVVGLFVGSLAGVVAAEHTSMKRDDEALLRLGLAVGFSALGAGLAAGYSSPQPAQLTG